MKRRELLSDPIHVDVSRRMSVTPQKHTAAEMVVRRQLHSMGLRYRVDYLVLQKPRRVADIVFPVLKIAVFIDGCFWHGCSEHGTWPKRNANFWKEKILANRSRDLDTNSRLNDLGWKVIRIWEHEDPTTAAEKIAKIVFSTKKRQKDRQ